MTKKRQTPISSRAGSVKSAPERTCIACCQVKAKRDLVRLVKTKDEGIVIDTNGKKPGRGAYLCKTKECWENGLKGNRLEYVMRTTLTQEDLQRLKEYAAKL
ncbi:MAG: RNase P modulator RnpM [Dehalococcoidales bacterium]